LSIGCLLATFEKRATGDRTAVRVGMAHVESRRYEESRLPAEPRYQLISTWIAGECYAVPPAPVAANVNKIFVSDVQAEPFNADATKAVARPIVG
jgi:hypothetical protein